MRAREKKEEKGEKGEQSRQKKQMKVRASHTHTHTHTHTKRERERERERECVCVCAMREIEKQEAGSLNREVKKKSMNTNYLLVVLMLFALSCVSGDRERT